MRDAELGDAFRRLYATVERLRAPDGCPWDRQQTHHSLRPYLLEEAYEVLEALDEAEARPERLRDELGDLLFQVLIHSVIAAERGAFHAADVLEGLRDKLVRRHPHVFGDRRVQDADEVVRRWEAIKRAEAAGRAEESWLAEPSATMPSLRAAYRVQRQAARVGFDWPGPEPALAKVEEEARELLAARAAGDAGAVEREAGDLLFAAVNVVRLCGVDPELALRGAVHRFVRRFRAMEERARTAGASLEQLLPEELEALWQESKRGEGGSGA